jgi:hypothetical protein
MSEHELLRNAKVSTSLKRKTKKARDAHTEVHWHERGGVGIDLSARLHLVDFVAQHLQERQETREKNKKKNKKNTSAGSVTRQIAHSTDRLASLSRQRSSRAW